MKRIPNDIHMRIQINGITKRMTNSNTLNFKYQLDSLCDISITRNYSNEKRNGEKKNEEEIKLSSFLLNK